MVTVEGLPRVLAISEGLLPPDRKLEKFFSYANLENGLLAGALIFLIGLGLSIYAVLSWHAHHFGPLNVAQMLRLTPPAATPPPPRAPNPPSTFFLAPPPPGYTHPRRPRPLALPSRRSSP